jgi:hypothetical protein
VRSDVENLSRKPHSNCDYYETVKVAIDEEAACKDEAALQILSDDGNVREARAVSVRQISVDECLVLSTL